MLQKKYNCLTDKVDNIALLSLVKLGIGHRSALPDVIDWQVIKALADKQGLTAIIVDGIEQLPDTKHPPKEFLLQWIGEVFQNYENRYKLYQRAIAELAGWYNAHGFKMMVLKGYACCIDWPKPEHRPCGDIDIWLFGKQKEADALIAKEKDIKIDKSHHHHTVFYWKDIIVENHYDFDNIYARKSNREIEPLFKSLGKDTSYLIEIYGERVYLPSPNLNALFLIRHLAAHFVGSEINIRQVLDWAFFVEKHTKEVDWGWLDGMLVKYHMKDFYNCVNAICVEELGFKPEIFGQVQFEPALKDRILQDTLSPEFTEETPDGFVKRIGFKYRRWKANSWKRRMCYEECDFEMFIRSAWAHIVKPAHI